MSPAAAELAVVGLLAGQPVGAPAAAALGSARVVVGGRAQLAALARPDQRQVCLQDHGVDGALGHALDALAAGVGPVCVLASGDPGFFGIGRALAALLAGADGLVAGLVPDVHPAPSAVSLAFARLARPWDDAAVVSGHGRDPEAACAAVRAALAQGRSAAVLTSPGLPPEALGAALEPAAVGTVHVCSSLAEPDEAVTRTDRAGLASRRWPHRSVVVVDPPGASVSAGPTVARALAVDELEHRGGMITKPEVRAVVLARLALPDQGVLWDLGAGSASVAIEAALAAPGMEVVAVERRAGDAERARANAARHGVDVEVVNGEAPAVLEALADPDRVFVGGGGLEVLDAALARLRPGGRVVMTCTALETALGARLRLGSAVQLAVSQLLPIGTGHRMAPDNPVLVVWGP